MNINKLVLVVILVGCIGGGYYIGYYNGIQEQKIRMKNEIEKIELHCKIKLNQ